MQHQKHEPFSAAKAGFYISPVYSSMFLFREDCMDPEANGNAILNVRWLRLVTALRKYLCSRDSNWQL